MLKWLSVHLHTSQVHLKFPLLQDFDMIPPKLIPSNHLFTKKKKTKNHHIQVVLAFCANDKLFYWILNSKCELSSHQIYHQILIILQNATYPLQALLSNTLQVFLQVLLADSYYVAMSWFHQKISMNAQSWN